ncbi:MAG: UDP-N-acetylmuramoyl-L-alanyl-D-glutamate--2,6-diaminopimelate ligase [Phycisphaerae bacterium]|nr:UDP-N-acetylmuramoyl-L-alanyl-D-glutamate--2,6-diaminopimelate ligase [Phycisphaerae bacterium]HAW94666.1 UDP-N-acetylmuramoyl-L-alanyl-D-glutamate--2,6-diaminopimelate ligase [Phycisphaerales bacterium]
MHENSPTLEELFDDDVVIEGDPSLRPRGVAEDSRAVVSGGLFVARAGSQLDGARFIEDALRHGAAAVVLGADETFVPSDPPPTVIRTSDPRRTGARAAHRFHGMPCDDLSVIGITGTNGKTTVAWFVRALLAAAGRRCGLVGTIEIDDGVETSPSALTTPSACVLADSLGRMVRHGCDSVVLEASSHALDQGRLFGVSPRIGLFTNLSGDHLDYHGTLDTYASAKARLFESIREDGLAIVNVDDPAHERMIRDARCPILRCSTRGAEADAHASMLEMTRLGSRFRLEGPWGVIESNAGIVGRHNAENLLLAVAAVHALGVASEKITAGIATIQAPPGRLEPVPDPQADFSVFVDYAHTDDALENVLEAARPLVAEGARLSVLFGCGGDRDRTKRPRMAQVAQALADRIIVTSDNPRTEDPDAIVEDILTGLADSSRDSVLIEVDRARAIDAAIDDARSGDVLVIAGKGHEDYQIIGTERTEFDDRRIASAALARRGVSS